MVLYRIKLIQEHQMKLDDIKELMQLFEASKLEKVYIKQKDFEIEMKKRAD